MPTSIFGAGRTTAGTNIVEIYDDGSMTVRDASGSTIVTITNTGTIAGYDSLAVLDSKALRLGSDGDIRLTHDGTDSVVVSNADAGVMDFHDDVFQIVDPAAPTKKARLDCGAITAGQTRVLTLPDRDLALNHIPSAIADPGDMGNIPVTQSGWCAITTGASGETRGLAIPTFLGQRILIYHTVDGGGAAVITVDSAFNEAGNVTITLDDAGEAIELTAIDIGGTLTWRATAVDGATPGGP